MRRHVDRILRAMSWADCLSGVPTVNTDFITFTRVVDK